LKSQLFLVLIFLGISYFSCRQEASNENSQNPALQQAFKAYTAQKDSLFRKAIWSPIDEEERPDFEGLKYYPYDPQYRFNGSVIRYDDPDSVSVYATRAGDIRPAVRIGYFAFEYQRNEYRLQIFKMSARQDPSQIFLFLGFTDRTTGVETYGAGRYIDIENDVADSCVIDFNYAYNPYCAYNERYSCALPPKENALPFALRAGEKIYEEH